MLILTRRVGETLMIGDDIEVTVLAVTGNQMHTDFIEEISPQGNTETR